MTYSNDKNENFAEGPFRIRGSKHEGPNAQIKTSIRVDREIWQEFWRETHRRGTSACPVLETLMLAYLQGMARTRDGSTTVVVNLTMQHVVERPRRVQSFEDMVYYTRRKIWPPSCEKADEFIKSTREVGCLEVKEFVPLDQCWRCFIEGQR